ncbi:sensor histidine kinase [Spirosoma rhododendri]|uniref:histidine kinase n=1 Tax=Spirosoma rhododendri TaxID=2728024 RepID=A0A7L5DXV0_9BACT|nr:ATP-binding protein [Spirosoma rhododendri]QJD81468.1 HAMP domain-containing protein [Spirosoma rhododendri]
MNIRVRLTLLFGLLVGSILLLFSVSVYYLYSQFREQEFQKRLQELATTTVRLRNDAGEVAAADLPILAAEQVTIYDDKGKILYSRGKPSGRYAFTPAFFRQVLLGETPYVRQGDRETVGVRYTNASNSGRISISVASAYDRYGFSKLERLRNILLFGGLLCLVIVAIAGYLFAADALRPVAELIDQANTISATNIHKRLQVGRQRDELADLARTFNELLSRLEKAFVSQKSFVSHASHELRTPLTVMMGQIEVTRLQPRSVAEYETAIDGLLDEVQNMIRLVNGLLELARANTGFPNLPKHAVRLDELLWQAQSQLTHKKADYQINIDFDELPNQEDDLVILGDESLLQTAFQNLMENGCKYSPDHSVMVRISFLSQQIQVTVSDQGYGIPASDLPSIFEPFYRSDSTMTISGYGIGLALTKRIIEIHQGSIDVHSSPGKGTTFRVCLPNKSVSSESATPTATGIREGIPVTDS